MAALIVLAVVLAVVAALALSGGGSKNNTNVAVSTPAGNASCTTDTKSDPGRNHITNPTYTVNPPAGGDHYPTPAGAGIYTASPPTDGELVHSLEHGYIILWFDPSKVVGQDIQNIETVFNQYPHDTLVVPRVMSVPIAATAWHQRLLCQGYNGSALADFIAKYRNKGPEQIPHP